MLGWRVERRCRQKPETDDRADDADRDEGRPDPAGAREHPGERTAPALPGPRSGPARGHGRERRRSRDPRRALRSLAGRDPDAVFLEVPGGERLTYGDTLRGSARLAHALRALGRRARRPRGGAGREVAVGDPAVPRVRALRRGAAPDEHRVHRRRGRATSRRRRAERPRVRPGPRRRTGSVPHVLTAGADGAGSLADLAARPARRVRRRRAPSRDDLAAILYTSGTTGRPKGAMLSQRNLTSNAVALHRVWGFRPDDVLLHALPIFHTHGLFVATNCVLANGTAMVFLPRFDAGGRARAAAPRCTVFMGVPTYYTRLLADPRLDATRCSSMRLFVSGSAPLLAVDPRGVRRPHRPRDPRALRHDRDVDDHVEPARRRSPPRHRRVPAARTSTSG